MTAGLGRGRLATGAAIKDPADGRLATEFRPAPDPAEPVEGVGTGLLLTAPGPPN